MKLMIALVTGVLLAFNASVVTVEAAEKQRFQAEDIFELEWADSVQISPDARYVVYVRNSNDIMTDRAQRSLWLLDREEGTHTPLFADEHNYSNPTWSPDGTRLAFTSNRSGSNQIHVYWLKQQKTARVTDVRNSPGGITWSPDGEYIAFSMEVKEGATDYARSVYRPSQPSGASWNDPALVVERTYYQQDGRGILDSAYRHIFVVPAEGGTERKLTEGNFNHGGTLAWHPSGDYLVFSANRNEDWEFQTRERDLWQVTLEAELTRLSDIGGQQTNPVFSPDGSKLAYVHGHGEPVSYRTRKLHVRDMNTGDIQELMSDFDRSVGSLAWLGNDRLTYQYTDRGLTKVGTVTLDGQRESLISDLAVSSNGRPYLSGMYSISDSGVIAYTRANSQQLGNVAVYDRGSVTQMTRLNESLFAQRKLGEVHEITYNSSHDGQEIHGWYITPPDFDPEQQYPLILEIHGGPHLAYGPHFAAELQRYAAEGYVVFYNNYRGSTSYGEDFAMLLHYNYSSPYDFEDHMSGVDAMLETGFVDENNLFIAGGSAGGIGTLYAIGLTDRFNAAAATNPVVNWVSKVLTADSYLGQIQNQFPGMPWEEHEHYWERSPLSLVGNVTTPTVIFTGENDRRTPMSDTEQFYQALKLKQVDSAMVRLPNASHGVSARPTGMIAKIEHALAWFALYKNED